MNGDLAARLTSWLNRDQTLRLGSPDPTGWQAFDREATVFLRGVVERWGWPGKSLVGERVALAAFVLAQHSPDLAFQVRVLALLRTLPALEVEPAWAAYLEDRVRIGQGQLQVYGTQVQPDGQPFAIEHPDEVDTRRASVGLEPLAEYLASFS